MAIRLNHTAFKKLAELDTTNLGHAKRLQLFAKTLGFDTGASLMARARAEEPSPAADPAALVQKALEEAATLAAQLRDNSAVPTSEVKRRILALAGGAPSGLVVQDNTLMGQMPGRPVQGRISSDDNKVCVHVDARPWLLSLNDEEIRGLVVEDYNNGYVSDGLLEHATTNMPETVAALNEHLASLSRAGSDDYGFYVVLAEAEVIGFLAANRPDPHGALDSMVEDGLIDVDLAALRGDAVFERNDVLITVSCLVGRDDLDPEDMDEHGDDAIGGHFRYTVLSDAPISAALAFEKALDEFHNDYAIAVLDNYDIDCSVFVEEDAPDELVDHGTIEVDAPLGFDSEKPPSGSETPSPM